MRNKRRGVSVLAERLGRGVGGHPIIFIAVGLLSAVIIAGYLQDWQQVGQLGSPAILIFPDGSSESHEV